MHLDLDVRRNRVRWFGDLSPLLGLAPGTFSGRFDDFLQCVHPADRASARDVYVDCLKGDRPVVRAEERVVWPDGTVRWLENYGRGRYDAQGLAIELSGVVRDCTERKQQEAKYRAVFETVDNAIAIARLRDAVHLEVNSAWERLTGIPRESAIGRAAPELGIWPVPGELAEVMRRLEVQGSVSGHPTRFRSAAGREFDVLLSGSLREIEGERCVLWSWNDVSALRQAQQASAVSEAALRELNASLEQRVAERTAALEAANRELESFSYSVSHDLRAPLRAIAGFAAIIREDFMPLLPPEAHEQFARIEGNAVQMGELIDDLLEFSRTGRAAIEPRKMSMRLLVEDVVRELEGTGGVEIAIGDLPDAPCDSAMMKQVWRNLVGNAIKFSRHVASPRIAIGGRREGASVQYSIEDNGAGFDMRYAGRLFGVFQRLHRPNEFEGTGVGLAIVQRIISRHGGTVAAQGEEGKGARFSFTLPG